MNSVGIDVSKGKSMVCIVRPLGEVVRPPFEVHHTEKELQNLAEYLKGLDGDTRIIMEHTGNYYVPVAQSLHKAGLYVSAVNPKLVKDFGNNSLRKIKTDKADAKKIARYGLDNWAELRQYTEVDSIRSQMKNINRQYNLYSKQKTATKNNLISLLDQTYPELNGLFDSPTRKDGHQKWVDFAETFWHADCVRKMSLATFKERYRKWCKKHGYQFQESKVNMVHEKAKELIVTLPKDFSTKLLIQQAVIQLNAVSKTVEVLRAELQRLAQQLPEYPVVMAMYGTGNSLGPQLMAEIGDVSRFTHRGALIAYAGVDPGAVQSGKYEAKRVRSSKHGAPELRRTLFLIMSILIRKKPNDDPVFCFLDRKRAEGKPYYVYMTAAANKFLRLYYGKVKRYLKLVSSDTPEQAD